MTAVDGHPSGTARRARDSCQAPRYLQRVPTARPTSTPHRASASQQPRPGAPKGAGLRQHHPAISRAAGAARTGAAVSPLAPRARQRSGARLRAPQLGDVTSRCWGVMPAPSRPSLTPHASPIPSFSHQEIPKSLKEGFQAHPLRWPHCCFISFGSSQSVCSSYLAFLPP